MSTWRTDPVTLPGFFEDGDLPTDLADLEGFEHYNQEVALDIESGGSVELQWVDHNGTWVAFETISDMANQVLVANRPAIRFAPLNGARFRITWEQ